MSTKQALLLEFDDAKLVAKFRLKQAFDLLEFNATLLTQGLLMMARELSCEAVNSCIKMGGVYRLIEQLYDESISGDVLLDNLNGDLDEIMAMLQDYEHQVAATNTALDINISEHPIMEVNTSDEKSPSVAIPITGDDKSVKTIPALTYNRNLPGSVESADEAAADDRTGSAGHVESGECVSTLASIHMRKLFSSCLAEVDFATLFSSSSLQLTLSSTQLSLGTRGSPCMVMTLDPPWPPNFTLSCLPMDCFTLSDGMWKPPWPCLLAQTKSRFPPSLVTPWLGVLTRPMPCYFMPGQIFCFLSIYMYSSFNPVEMSAILLLKPLRGSLFVFTETIVKVNCCSASTSVYMSYLAWLVPIGLVNREDVTAWKYLPQVKTVSLNIRILILHFNQERLEVPPWPIDSLDFLLSVLISTMMRSLSMAPSLVRSSTPSAPYLSTSTIASCMLRTQGSCFTMNVDLWTPCMSDFTSTYCSLRITSFKNYTLPVAPMFLLMESMFSSTELSVYHFSSSTVLSMNCTSLFMVETTICLSVSSLSEEQSGRTKLDISLLKPYYSTVRELCCLIIAAASSVIEASLFMFPLHTVLMSRVEYPFSSLVMDIAFFTRIMWKPPWCLQFISNSMAWRLLWSILTSTILPCLSSLALSRSSTSLQLTLRRNSPRSSCIILSQDPPWPSRTQKTNFVWSCYDMTRSVCMMLYSSIWTLWKPITTCLLFLTIMCSKAEPLPPKSLWVDYSSLTITSYKNTPTVAPTLLLMGNMTIKLFVSSELCVLQFSSSTTVLDLDFLGHDVHGVLQPVDTAHHHEGDDDLGLAGTTGPEIKL